MLELRTIERFTGRDQISAEEAFAELSQSVRRFLWRYLSTLAPREQEREDVIAVVLERLWVKRHAFEVQGIGAWWSYVATIARRCALDRLEPQSDVELVHDVAALDCELIEGAAALGQDRDLLYRLADELWLGIDRDLPETERRKRLLAAQLHYLHGVAWREICEIIGIPPQESRTMLDGWLIDHAVLHDLVYGPLYIDSDTLTCLILNPDAPIPARDLDRLARAAVAEEGKPPEGWTWKELRVAIWRYRNGLLNEKIAQMDPTQTVEEIERTLEKCRARLPFEAIAREVDSALAARRSPLNPLCESGLWKRLVFQYHAAHELPHKQILERTEPAAQVGQFRLTSGQLNVWLSNGRLLGQLISYWRGRVANGA